MSFLRPDSEFMNAVSACTDYIILNLLCALCCLPVITAGASVTAKYYVSMKLVRGEEPAVTSAFFRAFKQNFRQSTIIWMILLLMMTVIGVDWYLIMKAEEGVMHPAFSIFLIILTVMTAGISFSVFPLTGRFHITIREAIKGAAVFTLMKLPRVLLTLVITVLTYLVGFWYFEWFPAVWLLSTAVMLYYNSRMFVKEFRKLEGEEEQNEQENESLTE